MLTLYVGPKRKEFNIHMQLLRSWSPAFDILFSEFKEGEEKAAYLSDDDVEVVTISMPWDPTCKVIHISCKLAAEDIRERVEIKGFRKSFNCMEIPYIW
jgi:hypothetical protein